MTFPKDRREADPPEEESPDTHGAGAHSTFGGVGNTIPKNDKNRKPSRRAIKLALDWQAPAKGGR